MKATTINHKEFSLHLITCMINDTVTPECLVSNAEYSAALLIITVTAHGAFTKIDYRLYSKILSIIRAYTPYVANTDCPWKAGNSKGNTSVEFIFRLSGDRLTELFKDA